jgi:hypothetical protein
MSSLFDETPETQLERARQKIYSGWVGERSVDLYNQRYAELCVRMYGDMCRGWLWSKSWSPAESEGKAPSGFQFNVSPRAPLFLRPFSQTALFSGTLCYPLSAGEGTSLSSSTKQKISHEHFANVNLNIERELRERVQDERDLGGKGNSNYAGIFWSFEEGKHEFYCVVQTHDTALSAQALQLIRDNEPESLDAVADYARALLARKTDEIVELADAADDQLRESGKNRAPYVTWMQMFFHNEEMRRIMMLQRRHRAAVALRTMRAAGVGPPLMKATFDENIQAILDDPATLHTTTNYVEIVDFTDPLSDLVYLSNLTSAWDTTSAGVIVRSSFEDGLALLRGTTPNPQFVDEDPDAHRASFVGVPVATGPTWRVKGVASPPMSAYVYATPPTAPHAMLHVDNWLSRSAPSWQAWERACGIVSPNTVLLKPSRVRISS